MQPLPHSGRIYALLFSCLLPSLTSVAQKKKPEFKIGIYVPPPDEFVNDEQYGYLKEAQIDYIQNVGGKVSANEASNLKTLDLAQKHGLKVYVHDARIHGNAADIEALVSRYKNHPATSGYIICDEPDSARLDWAIQTYRKISTLDPDKTPYVNLLPDYAVNNYEKGYVERWIEGAGPENLKYLSFDTYPFKVNDRYMKSYYNNLDIIRRAGLKYNVSTSCYLQVFGMDNVWRIPNLNEMRLNTFSILAYGIKNPVWFPYWTPPRSQQEPFTGSSVIGPDGKKSERFAYVKLLNTEMKQLGKTLIHLDAREVYHTGDSLWMGTAHPPTDFLLLPATAQTDVILSHLKDPVTQADYIMVVNKSITDKKDFSFRIKPSVKTIQEISRVTGKPVRTAFERKKGLLSASFLPGEGRLYQLH
ncbi:hypothetical protein GCM10027347_12120 [Larkinella harenae]